MTLACWEPPPAHPPPAPLPGAPAIRAEHPTEQGDKAGPGGRPSGRLCPIIYGKAHDDKMNPKLCPQILSLATWEVGCLRFLKTLSHLLPRESGSGLGSCSPPHPCPHRPKNHSASQPLGSNYPVRQHVCCDTTQPSVRTFQQQ